MQIITDYTLEKNITSDVEMQKERLPEIKEKTVLNELYTDGGYYSEECQHIAGVIEVKVHYNDMTGRMAKSDSSHRLFGK